MHFRDDDLEVIDGGEVLVKELDEFTFSLRKRLVEQSSQQVSEIEGAVECDSVNFRVHNYARLNQ